MMTCSSSARPSALGYPGRVRSSRSARSFSCLLALAMLLAPAAGCVRNAPEPPDVGQWPMAQAASPLTQPGAIAWVSARSRAVLEGSWSDEMVTVPGQIRAISRVPELEFRLRTDVPLRTGFLVFHEGGVLHCDTDGGEPRAVPLAPGMQMPAVRAAACLTPHESETGDVVALITGGETPPRAAGGEAEPAPWLSSAEVRLAWLQGERLIIGAPEPLAGTNPWRIRAGEFAGERENLLVCVYNQAPFDEVVRRRPWIYRVVQGDDALPRLEPRWRGTSFSRPFREATFGDFTGEGEGEIAALEVGEDGGRLLTAYRFRGFGLEGLAPSVRLPDVEDRLEAAHWSGDAADELVLRARDGRFLFYALDREAAELRVVLTIDGPGAVLGWIVTSASADEPGQLVCVLPGGDVWRTRSDEQRG